MAAHSTGQHSTTTSHRQWISNQKFQYLRAQLEGEAYTTIKGLPLTEENYDHTQELLKKHYGQPHHIVNVFMMRAMWDSKKKKTADLESLRSFHDNLETYVRGLKSLGKDEDSYGELLVSMLLDKLPSNICIEITRAHGNAEWTCKDLADIAHGPHVQHSTILLDEGATRSFVRKELVQKLNLKPTRKSRLFLLPT
jgi:hypothetical protein